MGHRCPHILNCGYELAIGGQRLTFDFPCLSPSPSAEFAPHFLEPRSVANIKSAEKRARQTIKRRAHNMASRSRLRTAMKDVLAAVQAGKKDEAKASLKSAVPVIDSMISKGVIHRSAGARYKSSLNARVKALVTAK
jgi:small subunit ribosomal protein S20